MNKNTLRTLALGFLSSAILTGLYATFVQGNVPVRGVSVNSLLNNQNSATELTSQYESDLSSLEEENQMLASLNEDYTKSIKELESEISEPQESSSVTSNITETTSSTEEAVEDETSSEDQEESNSNEVSSDSDLDVDPDSIVDFTISPGETSVDITNRLEAEGIVSSAQELQDLFEYWDLETVLQDGTYELHPGMSIHEVAEILTHYTYYYYE